MKTVLAFVACFSLVDAFACEGIISPPWFVLDANGSPVSLRVFEVDGQEKLDLVFEGSNGGALIKLQKPGKGYKWVYGTCAPQKKIDQAIFALVRVPQEDGWVPEIRAAYRVNLQLNAIDTVPLSGLYCFAAAT